MKRLLTPLPVLILLLLAACGPSTSRPTNPDQLPSVPVDIQLCFRAAAGLPEKALNAGEVEALWKNDRVRVAVNARCGARLLHWYEDVRKNWR